MVKDEHKNYNKVHDDIQKWYRNYGRRELPWRNVNDPYAIYLSEVMLQQTQVKTVLDRFYTPFLEAFPSLSALADAPQEAVMKRWEGLGYYSRARNLHKAAKQCDGQLPDNVDALLELPGIGKNTAHAVACFAFKRDVPIMEANLKRVLCRVFALEKADEKILWKKAWELLDSQRSFDYNQAMMDIGAMVCVKRNPRCDICPLANCCAGKDAPDIYPQAKAKKKTPIREKHIFVYVNAENNYRLESRQTAFLNGLYGFVEHKKGSVHIPDDAILLGGVEQVYSHFKLEADVWLIRDSYENRGYSIDEIHALPLSKADQKVMVLIDQNEG